MDERTTQLGHVRFGLFLSLLAILLGFSLGGIFGANEDGLRSYLGSRADSVLATVYKGDKSMAKRYRDRGWGYLRRAHLHAGAIGAASVATILVLAFLPLAPAIKKALSLAIGIGGLGYPGYWLLLGLRVPLMGSSTAAKESLSWLAIPTAGLLILGIAAVAVLTLVSLSRPSSDDGAS